MGQLPGVKMIVQDGNLVIQPGSSEEVCCIIGPCTAGVPNTLYSFGDITTAQQTLGVGEGVELLAYVLDVAGGPVQFMPALPSQAGALGSVTHSGTGVGTLTLGSAPHQPITAVVIGAGALGTATATYQVGTGSISQPVVLPTGHTYFVSGTYCTITWPTHTYNAGDTYVFNTDGTITFTAGAGGTTASPTQASSPIDRYNALITITTAGANGTMQFTYSLDNGETRLKGAGTTSAAILSPGGGVYAIPGSGVVLTFSGTQTALDTFQFQTASAYPGASDIAAANTALEGSQLPSIASSLVGVAGAALASVAAWATQAGVFETAAAALFGSGIYLRYFNECPTVGTVFVNSGTLTVDSADTDSTIVSAAQAVSASHVLGCAGDCNLTGPNSGLALRRSAMWPLLARAVGIEASRNPGDQSLPGLPGVNFLYRDETTTPALDAARFNTLRTVPGSVQAGTGLPGFFATDFHTMASPTSDYSSGMNARVTDRACTLTKAKAQPLTLNKVPTTTRNGVSGVITNAKADKIEERINEALETAMVDSNPADAVGTNVQVDRTHQISLDQQLIIAVNVQPFNYAKYITVNIGLTVQA